MSNRKILWAVVVCYILGFILFFMPFPAKIINIIIYLAIGLATGAYMVRSGFKANAQTDKTINDLKKELAKLKLELHVTSNQISAVSEQLKINLDENNGFAQQVYAQTAEMAHFSFKYPG